MAAPTPARDTPASHAFEELKARFLQEAWVTGGLEHPGIVPVYELGRTPKGIPYYTMRFVRGQQTLQTALDAVRDAPIEDRLPLLEPFLKLCDTVRYAHSRSVIHRDLKPDNVALGEFGEVVLLDWGLAKLGDRDDVAASRWQERVREFREAGDLRTVAGALGTPGYMSPEAAMGRLEQVDPKSDVYSLGVVLFEILTGRLPFEFRTYAEYLDRMAREEPPRAGTVTPGVPERLEALCAQCLARDRGKRPEDVATLARAVRSWQAASALEREIAEHLTSARTALDAAEAATGTNRLRQVDRAAGALEQAAAKQADNPDLHVIRARAHTLREMGIREREKASGRKLLLRAGVGVLALAAVTAVVVASVLEGRRQEAETARAQAEKARAETEEARQEEETARLAAQAAEGATAKERDAKSRALAEKTKALDDVLRLSESKVVRDLADEVDRLWPVHPDRADAMATWLGAAAEALSNRTGHAERLARLRERALPYADEDRERDHGEAMARLKAFTARLLEVDEEHTRLGSDASDEAQAKRAALEKEASERKEEMAALRAEIATRRTWAFEDRKEAWMHQVLVDLLAALDHLETSKPDIEARHAAAKTLAERSVEAHAGLWRDTIEAIAASDRYGGLDLAPQIGLVPLGPDPDSGLFEFVHLGSGSLPVRDAETKHLTYEEDAAVVLVLIPGGTFWMGAQSDDEDEPNYDAEADSDEAPVHEVTLSPYFLGKHELTQAQWVALTDGPNPSRYEFGEHVAGHEVSPRNPVEQISWEDCDLWLDRWALALPTEAQWEHACRAGTDTPWHPGREESSLQGYANIADAWFKAHGGRPEWAYAEAVDDGHSVHAPVGTYLPNAFGLLDTHGSLWEWCRDTYRTYRRRTAVDAQAGGPGHRVYRGGSWSFTARDARSANRTWSAPGYRNSSLGVRPAKSVTAK